MKKKVLKLTVALVSAISILAACGQNNAVVENTVKEEVTEAKAEESTQKETKYKDTLLPFDQLEKGKKLLFLQNTLTYSRDGFYTESTAPKSEKIDFDGEQVDAYKITYTTALLLDGVKDAVDVYLTDGSSSKVEADDFNGMYVVLGNLEEGNPPTLYNPTTNTTIKDFKYAKTTSNEIIYSIVSEQEVNILNLINEVAWDNTKTYRLMATDYFYIPVDPTNAKTGMLLGTLSGAINANLPDITFMKSGKINDIMYLEDTVTSSAN